MMRKIISITQQKDVDQGQRSLQCFRREGHESELAHYKGRLLSLIRDAKDYICIAATSELSEELLTLIHQYKKSTVRIYIILQSFDDSLKTLHYFSSPKRALIRQVSTLNNNFIVSDSSAFLLLNPSREERNIFLEMTDNERHDLHYIFNDYFWNKASLEKILIDITEAKASPFPPFSKKLKHAAIIKSPPQYDVCILPQDNGYKQYTTVPCHSYLSQDLLTPIFIASQKLFIGNISISSKHEVSIEKHWRLTELTLAEISQSEHIIPFDEAWEKEITLDECIEIDMEAYTATGIENMEQTKPSSFPDTPYARLVKYSWQVHPPGKPNNAKKAGIYREYDVLQEKFDADCTHLNQTLITVKSIQSPWKTFFTGADRQINEYEQKLQEYISYDIQKLKKVDLDDLLKEEFKDFFEEIVTFSNTYKRDLAKKEQEEIWKQEKKRKETLCDQKIQECSQVEQKVLLNSKYIKQRDVIDKQLKKTDKKDKEEHSELVTKQQEIHDKIQSDRGWKKNKNKLKSAITALQADLKKNYDHFSFQEKINELDYMKPSKHASKAAWVAYKLPLFVLPEVGHLFEDQHAYFLAIQYSEELEKANEIAQYRYLKNKTTAKVIVELSL